MTATGRHLLIYGAGGHGRVIADAARAASMTIYGFGDDNADKRTRLIADLPVVATGLAEAIAMCRERGLGIVCGLGDNERRRSLYEEIIAAEVELVKIVHPTAVVAPSAVLGAGCVLMAGAIVNPDARIGANVIINTAASLDHDNLVGDHVHISPGVHTGGAVRIGVGTHVGVGASIRNGISIGSWSLIGAGAVVVRDIPDHVVAYGNPARVRRPRTHSPLA